MYEELRREIDELKSQMADMQLQMASLQSSANQPKAQNDLILRQTHELVIASSKQIAKELKGELIRTINDEIAPKVNQALEYVSIMTEDGSESIESYRQVVEASTRTNKGRIEYNVAPEDARVQISPYISFGLAPVTVKPKK